MANLETIKSLFGEKLPAFDFIGETEWNLMSELFNFHRETAEHSVRVAILAHDTINKSCGLEDISSRELTFKKLLEDSGVSANTFLRSAMLHDVGKMKVRRELVCSPSRLNNEEREEMKLHESASFEILKRRGFESEASISGQHHNYKKEGPKVSFRLKGLKKFFSAGDLLHLIDVHDALRSKRTYKPALSMCKVLPILYQEAIEGFVDKNLAAWYVQANSITLGSKMGFFGKAQGTGINVRQGSWNNMWPYGLTSAYA